MSKVYEAFCLKDNKTGGNGAGRCGWKESVFLPVDRLPENFDISIDKRTLLVAEVAELFSGNGKRPFLLFWTAGYKVFGLFVFYGKMTARRCIGNSKLDISRWNTKHTGQFFQCITPGNGFGFFPFLHSLRGLRRLFVPIRIDWNQMAPAIFYSFSNFIHMKTGRIKILSMSSKQFGRIVFPNRTHP